jgi:hypothetical protein
MIFSIVNTNIIEMTKDSKIEFYQNRLEVISTPILDYLSKFNLDERILKEKLLKSIDFTALFSTITSVLTTIISNA